MTSKTPQRKSAQDDQQLKILRKQNDALLEELEFWRSKYADQEKVEGKQLQHILRENEILRTKFIQLELKNKAQTGSDGIIRDLRARSEQLEQENKSLNFEIEKYIERIKEYEIIIAKIRQNEDEIRLFHMNLKDENENLKRNLHQQLSDMALQYQAKENFNKGRQGQLESSYSAKVSQLAYDLNVQRDKAEKLTRISDQLKQDVQVLQNNLAAEYDLRRQNEMTIEMLQKKAAALEDAKSKDYQMLMSQKDQSLSQYQSLAIQEKEQLLRQIGTLEAKLNESQSLMAQLLSQNQALQHQLILAKDQAVVSGKTISDLTTQLNMVTLASQQEIVKRDMVVQILSHKIRNSQLEEIRQTHIAQAGSMTQYQEQLKNELVSKMQELDLNQKAVEKLTLYINRFEFNINQLISELELWKNKYVLLEQQRTQELILKDHHYSSLIEHFRKALYEQLGTSESKIQNLKNMLDKKQFECNVLKEQKEDLSWKFQQYNQQVQNYQMGQQRLISEIEATQQKLIESRSNSPQRENESRYSARSPPKTANFGI